MGQVQPTTPPEEVKEVEEPRTESITLRITGLTKEEADEIREDNKKDGIKENNGAFEMTLDQFLDDETN